MNQLLDNGDDDDGSSERFFMEKAKEQLSVPNLNFDGAPSERAPSTMEPASPVRRRCREKGVEDPHQRLNQAVRRTASAHIVSPRRRRFLNNGDDNSSPLIATMLSIPTTPSLADMPLDDDDEDKPSVAAHCLAAPPTKPSRRQSFTSSTTSAGGDNAMSAQQPPRASPPPRRASLSRTSSMRSTATTTTATTTHTTPRRLGLTGVSLTSSTGHVSPRRQSSSRRLLMQQQRRNSRSRLMPSGDESTLGDARSFADGSSVMDGTVVSCSRRPSVDGGVVSSTEFHSCQNANTPRRRLSLTGVPLRDSEGSAPSPPPSTPRRQASRRRLSISGKRGNSNTDESTVGGDAKVPDGNTATTPKPRRASLAGVPLQHSEGSVMPSPRVSPRRQARRNSTNTLATSDSTSKMGDPKFTTVSTPSELSPTRYSKNQFPTSDESSVVSNKSAALSINRKSRFKNVKNKTMSNDESSIGVHRSTSSLMNNKPTKPNRRPSVGSSSQAPLEQTSPRQQLDQQGNLGKAKPDTENKRPNVSRKQSSRTGSPCTTDSCTDDVSIDLSLDLSVKKDAPSGSQVPTKDEDSPRKSSFLRTLVRQASKTRLALTGRQKPSNKVPLSDDADQPKSSGNHEKGNSASAVSSAPFRKPQRRNSTGPGVPGPSPRLRQNKLTMQSDLVTSPKDRATVNDRNGKGSSTPTTATTHHPSLKQKHETSRTANSLPYTPTLLHHDAESTDPRSGELVRDRHQDNSKKSKDGKSRPARRRGSATDWVPSGSTGSRHLEISFHGN